MGALASLKTKKWGLPLWAWAIVVAVVGYFAYRWYQNRSGSSAAANPAASTAGTTGADQSGLVGYPGGSGDSGGGSPFFPQQNPPPVEIIGSSSVQPANPNESIATLSSVAPNQNFGGANTANTGVATKSAGVKANNPLPFLGTPSVVDTTTGKVAAVVYNTPPKVTANIQAGDFPSGGSYQAPATPPAKSPVTKKSTPTSVEILNKKAVKAKSI